MTAKLKRSASQSHPPAWIKPQLTRVVEEAPPGGNWLREIKYDGYRNARALGQPARPAPDAHRPRLVAPLPLRDRRAQGAAGLEVAVQEKHSL